MANAPAKTAGDYGAESARLKSVKSFGRGHSRRIERINRKVADKKALTPVERARLDHWQQYLDVSPTLRATRNRETALYTGLPRLEPSRPVNPAPARQHARTRRERRTSTGSRSPPDDDPSDHDPANGRTELLHASQNALAAFVRVQEALEDGDPSFAFTIASTAEDELGGAVARAVA